ncbi:MAG TPA: hypothetical protein VGE69_14075 [Pseudomonadales bacterium]
MKSKLKLIRNARRLWYRLWSVRLSLLAAVFSAAETGIHYYVEGKPPLLVLGAAVVSITAAAARLVQQSSLEDDYANAP